MGKKKFIDKKKSATFQLFARDTFASTDAATSDRVFVRVDNNPYSVHALEEFGEQKDDLDEFPEHLDADSVFADAPGDTDDEGTRPPPWIAGSVVGGSRGPLPDSVRKEILELGLPDDGYNYLLHLREIKNSGGGSAYYENSKAKFDRVALDVKAYDASRLRINADVGGETLGDSNSIYKVASKAVGVRVQKAVDPDVARLLDDSDLSRFESDVEDLDEDFVVKANLPDEGEEEEEEVEGKQHTDLYRDASLKEDEYGVFDGDVEDDTRVDEKPRVRRLLDEQFDLLTLREYDNDSDDDDTDADCIEDDPPLAAKLNDALKPFAMDKLELEDKYRVPADFMHNHKESNIDGEIDITTDVIRKCVEYAEKYCNESHDDEELVEVQESSDESDVWDCETIVSTYSNLDNHPGKIQAPGNPKRRVPKDFPGDSVLKNNIIELRGKDKLPADFLPRNRTAVEKVKAAVNSDTDKQKRKPISEESKEEKKERKGAVKEEKREARKAKKELKGLYKFESQKAQKVAAVARPSSIHLL